MNYCNQCYSFKRINIFHNTTMRNEYKDYKINSSNVDDYYTRSRYASTYDCNICGQRVDNFELHFLAYHIDPNTIKQFAFQLGLSKAEEPKPISIEVAIKKLNEDNPTATELISAISSLKNAGWKIISNPAIATDDRKGYQISILEPKGK
jgi:uncharacterized protein YdgA (DUF945 family)